MENLHKSVQCIFWILQSCALSSGLFYLHILLLIVLHLVIPLLFTLAGCVDNSDRQTLKHWPRTPAFSFCCIFFPLRQLQPLHDVSSCDAGRVHLIA